MVMELVHRYPFTSESSLETLEEINYIFDEVYYILSGVMWDSYPIYVGYSLGDTDVQFRDLPIGLVCMTMYREDYPYTVDSISAFLNPSTAKYIDMHAEEYLPVVFSNNHEYFNQEMYSKVSEINITNITSAEDSYQVLFEGEKKAYVWYGGIYLWGDPEINGREMTVDNTDMLEFNKYCIDFLVDELIDSFGSYEDIDVLILYVSGLYWEDAIYA